MPALGEGTEPSTITSVQVRVIVFNLNKSFKRFVPSHPPKMNRSYLIIADEWFALCGG
jgi:hypothetical protein